MLMLALPIWLCDKTIACYTRGPKFDSRRGPSYVLATRSDWQTLVSSVYYDSLVSASADRDLKLGYKYCGLQYSPTQQGHSITRAYISLQ